MTCILIYLLLTLYKNNMLYTRYLPELERTVFVFDLIQGKELHVVIANTQEELAIKVQILFNININIYLN